MKDKKVMSTRWLKSVGTLAFALALTLPGVAGAQKTFDTPQAAVDALVDSLARQDNAQLRDVLGPDYRRLISLDDLSTEDRYDFLAAWAKGHRVVAEGRGPGGDIDLSRQRPGVYCLEAVNASGISCTKLVRAE